METLTATRVFKNGSSQAVRIPKSFQLDYGVVYLKKVRGGILLLPKDQSFEAMKSSLTDFTDDFLKERNQGVMEKRAGLE